MGFITMIAENERPNFTSLPVVKVTSYPLEKADYKPFAQGRFCAGKKTLYMELIAFEVSPDDKSHLKVAFQLTDSSSFLLTVNPNSIESFTAISDGKAVEISDDEIICTKIGGEDLQGIFWGFHVTIPKTITEKISPDFIFQSNSIIKGNIFKTSSQKNRTHFGSYYPVENWKSTSYEYESCGNFNIVNY